MLPVAPLGVAGDGNCFEAGDPWSSVGRSSYVVFGAATANADASEEDRAGETASAALVTSE